MADIRTLQRKSQSATAGSLNNSLSQRAEHTKTQCQVLVSAPSETAVPPSWLRRHRRRLAEIGAGHAIYATFNFFFDQVLYVYVVYRFGLLVGGAAMTLLSLVGCLVTLLVYERMRIDWVGSGSLAYIEQHPNPAWWQRVVLWATRRGALVIFLVLCIFQDPFITTAYFRRASFDGIRSRDWQIFFASVVVSNLYWTLRSGAVAAILVGAWHQFTRT